MEGEVQIEPRVVAGDVAVVLRRRVKPHLDGVGESIASVAERSTTPEDTVLRVMQGKWKTISLDLADRLLVACGGHISECGLVWKDRPVV